MTFKTDERLRKTMRVSETSTSCYELTRMMNRNTNFLPRYKVFSLLHEDVTPFLNKRSSQFFVALIHPTVAMVTLRPSLLKYTHTTNLLLSMIFSRMEGCAAKYKRNVEKLLVCQLIPFPLSFPLHIFPLILYFFYIIAAKTPKPTSFCTHKNLDSYSYLFFFCSVLNIEKFLFCTA